MAGEQLEDPLHPLAVFRAVGEVRVKPNAHVDGVVTIDQDFVVRGLNTAAEEIFGVPDEQARGRVIDEFVTDDQRAELRDFLTRVLRGESVPPLETRRHRPDHTSTHVMLTGTPLIDRSGAIVGAALYHHNIDELVEAREELRREHARFSIAASAAHVGVWDIDLGTMTMTGSPEFYRMNLLPADHGRLSWDQVLSALSPRAQDRVDDYLASGSEEFVFNYRVRHPEHLRIVRIAGRKLLAHPGDPGHIVGIAWDITEERAAQSAVEDARERFRRIFYGSLTPMAVIDGETHLLMSNAAHDDLLGYGPGELLGTPADGVVSARDRAERAADLAPFRQQGQVPSGPFELELIRKDGTSLWAETTMILLQAPQADELGEFLVQFRDVTAEREAAGRLQYLADHDPLTGLLNRRAFDRALTGHIGRTQLGHRRPTGALLLVDIDHFKQHNDTGGHAAGDAVLVAVTGALQARVRADDFVGRLGGDEFAVLLPDVTLAEAESVATDLLGLVRKEGAEAVPGSELSITVSIGIADFADRPDVETVMRRADTAMYESKSQGRDRWTSASPDGSR